MMRRLFSSFDYFHIGCRIIFDLMKGKSKVNSHILLKEAQKKCFQN